MTTPRTLPISLSFIALFSAAAFIVVKGSDVLIPLAIAGMVWYLLNALAKLLRSRLPGGKRLSHLASVAVGAVLVITVLGVILNLLIQSLSGITEAAAHYQENIRAMTESAAQSLGMEHAPGIQQLMEKIDIKWAVASVTGIATTVAGNVGIILFYVLFLILEQESFDKKLKAIFPDRERQASIARVAAHIQTAIGDYVLLKTLMCALVGFLTYVVLLFVGVDFAFFWAVVGFMTNYIPTVGSVAGVVLPSILALVQFSGPSQFLVVVGALSAVHLVIGNVVEPKLMGGKLNISPFVVILSLVVWGKLWGVTGMILCVPLTIIAMIVLAHFPSTRPVAVLLSEDGDVSFGGGGKKKKEERLEP